ncbi:DUF4355 domain-containing protein [Enterococcus dongliensis]|uniref:DUF4355 domain-containing protein n=1 Tax=Enterococcus dongliensis TaxID=2559925 RepID=A0AAW8TNK5_9ENTE|nr:DUF4355 domain-containing protein [Enterococcus dongliensis]MDT2635699.1 DUF4355 domain-containing protein [Enterococcus dongliensis]MDT2637645.1 DUF4355 domain-containing protein [Enterococcus dongliensis]MDT2642735.1 DUF4355 domain-containing protein [Enterococcus dongliensis]
MKNKFLMPMKLQFFADPDGEGDPGEATPSELNVEELNEEQLALIKKKYGFKDDKDVDSIVKSKKSRWQQEAEAKKEEAKKYAKMNAEEKLQHELEQKEAEIAELKRGQTLNEMKSEASKMLSGAGLPHDDELLGLIVSDDAEATKKAVAVITNFASLIKKENARQTTPGEGGQFSADKNTKQTVAELAAKNRIIK